VGQASRPAAGICARIGSLYPLPLTCCCAPPLVSCSSHIVPRDATEP